MRLEGMNLFREKVFETIDDPPNRWLTKLRQGNIVYCVKQSLLAVVEYPYESPPLNSYCGSICINVNGSLQKWLIDFNGKGINGTQCLLPLEGHVPENPEPLPHSDTQILLRRIDELAVRIESIEDRLIFNTSRSNWANLVAPLENRVFDWSDLVGRFNPVFNAPDVLPAPISRDEEIAIRNEEILNGTDTSTR